MGGGVPIVPCGNSRIWTNCVITIKEFKVMEKSLDIIIYLKTQEPTQM